MVIALGTIISALFSDKLTYLLGAGKVTALSVAITCVALFGFSFSDNIFALFLWSIPYGLGAGSVDAALNNYVAIHYTSRHMSWLHCMWGLGASIFGVKKSQAIVGVQMASAYIGTMIMPPIFGILANKLSMIIWPFYLVTILLLMIIMHERLIRIAGK